MNRKICLSAIAVLSAAVPSVASAASVFGTTSSAQLIGTLAANQAYSVTATGTIGLCGSCNGNGPQTFNPDGTSTNGQGAYAAFNSTPLDHDPSQPTNSSIYYGFYGPGIYVGALYGTFSLTPTAGDLFLIGAGTTIQASGASRTLYGVINDNSYGDNQATAFTATLNRVNSPGGVPEPATWATMLLGLGGVGYALRRRQQPRTRVRFI